MALTNDIDKALATADDSNRQLTDLLKSSIAKEDNERIRLQQMGKNIVRLEAQVKTLYSMLGPWLDEFEAKFDNNESPDSPEIASHYLDGAKYMRNAFKRDDAGFIARVQRWYDNYLPFGK
jgi:hypothetical protein